MKKATLALFALFIMSSFHAQQLAQYTQTTLNYVAVNPAATGSVECFDIKLGYRNQWTGFEGAPRTTFVSAHSKIGTNKKAYPGVGLVVENDRYGPFSSTAMTANFAYNFRINKRYRMAFGLGLGTMQYRLDRGILLGETGVGLDQAITQAGPEFLFPLVHFGWWLYKNDRFYGLAVRHITGNRLESISDASTITQHVILSHGRTIDIDDDLFFKPTVNVRYAPNTRISADLIAMLDYKDRISAGIGFRSEHGMSALLKINAFKYVTIGYAYDFTLNRVRLASRNTHEIILGVRACPRGGTKSSPCSAYD